MVKIAVAGGRGQIAREVVDVLLATRKHEITILSRNNTASEDGMPGVTWRAVDYDNKRELIESLRGIDTLLSFVQTLTDPKGKVQKNLIDAAVVAGVRRFAPSEWGSAETAGMSWWKGKEVREYLRTVNEGGKVIQYTLFQPGLLLDYLASPYKTAKHVAPLETMFDFQNRRAIVVDGCDPVMTLTTAEDIAGIVARAVEYDGEWPVIGGISGNRVTASRILEIGDKVRGRSFAIEKVQLDDLEAGRLKTSWTLGSSHPSYTGDDIDDMLKTVLVGILLSSAKGAWAGSDEMNRLFPDYEFTQAEDFLARVWNGKP